jgi:hypothetical protein
MAVVAGVCRAGRNGFAENQSQAVDSATGDLDDWAMSEIIYPRSPRETMDGWMYLPRYIDKIRLHLAGRLHADYQENLGKGFDGMWLKYAGIKHEQMIDPAEKAAHTKDILSRPKADDAEAVARLKMRKEQAGMANRGDITNFVDFIDADEKRI